MKKIVLSIGFLIAGLFSFNFLGAMGPSPEEQQEIQAAVLQELLEAQNMSDEDIAGRISALSGQLKQRAVKNKPNLRKLICAQRKALSDLLASKKGAACTQTEIKRINAEIIAYINEDAFKSFTHQDLDSSLQAYQELAKINVFQHLNAANNLVYVAIINFLRAEKENLTQEKLNNLLKNLKGLQPKKVKEPEEKKDDGTEKKEAIIGAIIGGIDFSAKDELLSVILSKQCKKWIEGPLQEDLDSANLLPETISDLRSGRFNVGHPIKAYAPPFLDVHIANRQRLYFAYWTMKKIGDKPDVKAERNIVLLYGGPKNDQDDDLKKAHAYHIKLREEYGKIYKIS
jgi:hypothetical protein